MTHVKTAISMRKDLFQQANTLARKMKISRSRLIETAFEEFARRKKTQEIVDSLNEFYATGPDPEEEKIRQAMWRLRSGFQKDNPW